jgi:FixJ family two-component response regulator
MLEPTNVTMSEGSTCREALYSMASRQVAAILCEALLDWKELLSYLAEVLEPPLLIVTSRLADQRLWAEALNLGSWDVLTKPFNEAEVRRVVESALHHWSERLRRATLMREQEITRKLLYRAS